jgi:hypothetical protein
MAVLNTLSTEYWSKFTYEQQKERIDEIAFKKHVSKSQLNTCAIIKTHHKMLEKDPERLSTDFIQKIVGKKCDTDNLKS